MPLLVLTIASLVCPCFNIVSSIIPLDQVFLGCCGSTSEKLFYFGGGKKLITKDVKALRMPKYCEIQKSAINLK